MNILLHSLMASIVACGFSVAAGAATIGFSGPGSYRFPGHSPPPAVAPWEYVLDVNGTEYEMAATGYAHVGIRVTDGVPGDPFLNDALWRQTDTAEIIGFEDGGRFKLVAYPSRRGAGTSPRIYTQVFRWVGDGIGDNFGFNALDAKFGALGLDQTEPMVAQNIEQLNPNEVLLEGVFGPRWTGDVVLFDEVVGGQQFTARLKEVGFGAWPDVLARHVIPEPSGVVLGGLCMAVGLWRRQQRICTS